MGLHELFNGSRVGEAVEEAVQELQGRDFPSTTVFKGNERRAGQIVSRPDYASALEAANAFEARVLKDSKSGALVPPILRTEGGVAADGVVWVRTYPQVASEA